jgi:hypothetical protein
MLTDQIPERWHSHLFLNLFHACLGISLDLVPDGFQLPNERVLRGATGLWTLALQLQVATSSESIGHHDSGPDDWWRVS